jgi:ribonuclease HI
MYGKVKGFDGTGPRVAATDASYKRGVAGIACVVSSGSWGLSRWAPGQRHDPTGPAAVLVAELRAVAFLLEGPDQPRPPELLLDSTIAIRYLRAWQRGRIERMPDGYSLLPRRGPQPAPTLVRLAGIMAQHPEMQLQHVHSHTGHPLNEAADALASLAQRGLPAVETRSRAEGLAEAFLRAWHEQANGA